MGEIGAGRIDQYVPLSLVRARLGQQFTLTDLDDDTGGPARYVRVGETGGKLGFITPMTHNFCKSCNRVRITCTGTLHTCLGQEDASDLRRPLRASAERRTAVGRDRPCHRAEAEGPRLHHRPPPQPAERQPPHERDRRLDQPKISLIYQSGPTVWASVNLPIFRLTARKRAEMVRRAFMPARPDGPLRDFRAAKTARSATWGGEVLQSLLQTGSACSDFARPARRAMSGGKFGARSQTCGRGEHDASIAGVKYGHRSAQREDRLRLQPAGAAGVSGQRRPTR